MTGAQACYLKTIIRVEDQVPDKLAALSPRLLRWVSRLYSAASQRAVASANFAAPQFGMVLGMGDDVEFVGR